MSGRSAFDNQTFEGGVQLLANNYANVIQAGGSGEVTGIGNVKQVSRGLFGLSRARDS